MKPTFIPHASYQNFVLNQLKTHYSGGILTLVNKDWPVISKLWITDLSTVTTWLYDSYSNRGPKPRDPASMMRSYLLSLLVQPAKGITDWVDQLHRVPLYAILSGFELGDLPGVGTFEDFFKRLWGSSNPDIMPKIKPKKKKSKGKKKPKKGEKAAPRNPGIVEKLVERFLRYDSKQMSLPADRLYRFFKISFLMYQRA